MENTSVILPPSDPNALQNIQNCFSQPVYDMNSLNVTFFGNQCPFFPSIQQNYPNEALEFLKVIKYLSQLALNTNNILPPSIQILKKMQNLDNIELTRKQVALLFLLSFFDVLPITFSKELNTFKISDVLREGKGTSFEIARCFLNYLTIIGKWLSENNPILEEKIIYVRENINRNNFDFLAMNNFNLCPVNFIEQGSLFYGNAPYCVDFANKYVGGSILKGASVQEEILFAINPEATVAMLFMESMDENDGIGIFNTIQYSNYKGYAQSFEFNGTNIFGFPSNIKRNRIIAIDAERNDKQLNSVDLNNYQRIINRDIYKAFAGFNLTNFEMGFEKSISTGNWGCGVYNGIFELKFLEQWIAASFAGVQRLDYYTFGKEEMQNAINCYEFIKNKFVTAANLYRSLMYYKLDAFNLINCLVNGQF
jgi:poly(ADP-ribose) glycohydrolase